MAHGPHPPNQTPHSNPHTKPTGNAIKAVTMTTVHTNSRRLWRGENSNPTTAATMVDSTAQITALPWRRRRRCALPR